MTAPRFLLAGGLLCGAAVLGCSAPSPSPHPSASPSLSPLPSPTATATANPRPPDEASCPEPWPGEDGRWVGLGGREAGVWSGEPAFEQTKDLVRGAQQILGNSCGRPYAAVNRALVAVLNDNGACAGVMGEAQDKVFVRVEQSGPQHGWYEQWHLAYAKNGCLVTGPQQGLWTRR